MRQALALWNATSKITIIILFLSIRCPRFVMHKHCHSLILCFSDCWTSGFEWRPVPFWQRIMLISPSKQTLALAFLDLGIIRQTVPVWSTYNGKITQHWFRLDVWLSRSWCNWPLVAVTMTVMTMWVVMILVSMCIVFVSTSMTMSSESMSFHSLSNWVCRLLLWPYEWCQSFHGVLARTQFWLKTHICWLVLATVNSLKNLTAHQITGRIEWRQMDWIQAKNDMHILDALWDMFRADWTCKSWTTSKKL